MAISPLSSAKTHSLCSMFLLLCFFFYVLCFVVLVCSSSSAQFCISSLVSSNPTISHKRHESGNWRFVLLLPFRWTFNGLAWLFLDVSTNTSLLYKEVILVTVNYHSKLVVDFAVSREQTNEKGEKMYIQTRMAEYAEELWELLKKKDNTFVYMCGLKGMEKGIDEIMISLSGKDRIDWLEYKKQLKRSEQRNVEIY
ncbi:hypothetical protein HID58_081356 [Brassica napus]|uniref:Oxidoreductase FAD/NAD(P)-binding domain-containing protein n=1 Tax=Brassica napus TaxID=3708 RepID=A0ABQ7Y7I0_BRANA|nr:hypothetical protein HID58_081356 [Brassica napus]